MKIDRVALLTMWIVHSEEGVVWDPDSEQVRVLERTARNRLLQH